MFSHKILGFISLIYFLMLLGFFSWALVIFLSINYFVGGFFGTSFSFRSLNSP